MGNIVSFVSREKIKDQCCKTHMSDETESLIKESITRQQHIRDNLPDIPRAAMSKLWEMLCKLSRTFIQEPITKGKYDEFSDILSVLEDYITDEYEEYLDDEPCFLIDMSVLDNIDDYNKLLHKWNDIFCIVEQKWKESYDNEDYGLLDCVGYVSMLHIKLFELSETARI